MKVFGLVTLPEHESKRSNTHISQDLILGDDKMKLALALLFFAFISTSTARACSHETVYRIDDSGYIVELLNGNTWELPYMEAVNWAQGDDSIECATYLVHNGRKAFGVRSR
jgi:hypothetical protein